MSNSYSNTPSAVDVRTRVNVQTPDLFRRHVRGCADKPLYLRQNSLSTGPVVSRPRDPEIDYLRDSDVSLSRDEDISRLNVAVDHPLVVRMLNGLANDREQFQTRRDGQCVRITIFRDRHAANQFHGEPWPPCFGSAGVEHPGNVGMVHHCKGLPFRFEAGNDLLRIHSQLDDLQRDVASHWQLLIGQEDGAKPALPDHFDELVRSDSGAQKPLRAAIGRQC